VAGHGTLIAGLIRQTCPDADILPVPVIRADGHIAESEVITAIRRLRDLISGGGQAVDIVSLSLGAYYETVDDIAFGSSFFQVIEDITRLGVVVVCAAGNDSTVRELYPAAFARLNTADRAPVVCVGALNPDGTSVAMFSNSLEPEIVWQPGAAVVSTMPVAFDDGFNPLASVDDPGGRDRATIDPGKFAGGFAVCSGTSFAAPVFAGRLAALLLASAEAGGRRAVPLDAPAKRAVKARTKAVQTLADRSKADG
jgi:subtilisin family serine protease